ncbi:hypothetical protein TRAPUB_582 [Trametes pubescens]|uniref:DUF3669 domain-containing protein n=1 Tax=Trametes pubescens TaxID=154538 RepID=A0A1M2VLQ3_TRAPU|nr:hypothetical protein TRAPUB_582 [Trametes pubescens]
MSGSSADSLEPTSPSRIGAGSLATVFAAPGHPVVFKVVHVPEHSAQILAEYEVLHSVCSLCNSDSIFAIPRALAFYDPETDDLRSHPPLPNVGRLRRPRQAPNRAMFDGLPAQACYVMDRVGPLPRHLGQLIRSSMYPAKMALAETPLPLLCRLYFGKELRPSAFVSNFPIDVARYHLLLDNLAEDLLPKEVVAEGMGEMLSRIHWKAGYDARDIEFVMAGDAFGVRYYVIDYNQMRAFDKDHGDVALLVDAFFSNDPYYPRPTPGDPLYDVFKRSYVDSYPLEHLVRAECFLGAIEDRQAANRVAT